MILELEKYYKNKGFRLPNYSFTNSADNKGNKVYCAEIVLPNGKTIRGDPKRSKNEVCIFKIIILLLTYWVYI